MPDTRYYRQVRPSPRGGNIPMSAYGIHRAGQSYREMGRAGEMLTDIGIQALAENRKTEYYDQLNSGKLTALTDFAEYKQKLVENADTSTYLPELEKLQDAIRQRVKFTNKDAQDAFELWYAQEILSQNSDVQGDKLRVDTRNFVKNFNLSVNTLSDLASQALDEPTYQQRVTDAMEYYGLRPNEKTGRPELIPDWDNPLLYSDEVRRKGFEAWKAGTDEVRQKNIERATEEEDERLFQMALEAVGREPEQVETIIELMEMDGEQQSALRREARVLESSQRAEDKREQNAAFAQANQNFWKLFRNNDFEELVLSVDSSDLPVTGDGGKTWWSKLIDAKIKEMNKTVKVDIATDQRAKRSLRDIAISVGTGTVELNDFDAKLDTARYIDEAIDDSDHEELYELSRTQFKAYQTAALKRSLNNSAEWLIDFGDKIDLMQWLDTLKKKEDRQEALDKHKLQKENYRQYERAMYEFIKENPDANAEDIFIEGKRLLAIHRERDLEQINRQAELEEKMATRLRKPPKEYPNAVWNNEHKMWTVIRNGRLMGIE